MYNGSLFRYYRDLIRTMNRPGDEDAAYAFLDKQILELAEAIRHYNNPESAVFRALTISLREHEEFYEALRGYVWENIYH